MSNKDVRASEVRIQNLRKEFGDKVALSDVSIDISPGEFLVLLGPSGSGKTTLLRCLAGIERASGGSIEISGRQVVGPKVFVAPEKRGLAMVFQDYALWPHLTVRKNIGFPLLNSTLSKVAKTSRVDDLLERVGISHLADRFPNQLSGGEQQRVALARALAAEVGLILFDEPLSNLDADRRELLRIEIATLTREAGASAVYITHDQSEAFALADRIGVLNHGSLVQSGAPEEIYKNPKDAFVARFTGIAGEFPVVLNGIVGEGIADVCLPFAPSITIAAKVIDEPTSSSASSLFVRAAGVSLQPASTMDGAPGQIRDVAFNGRGYEHVVELDSDAVLTKIFSATRFDRGSNVKVCFDASSCFVMDPTRGKK